MAERFRIFADKGGYGRTSLADMLRVLESLKSRINGEKGYLEVYSLSNPPGDKFCCTSTSDKIRERLHRGRP